jgi:membrane-associated phospholipid phosphatase
VTWRRGAALAVCLSAFLVITVLVATSTLDHADSHLRDAVDRWGRGRYWRPVDRVGDALSPPVDAFVLALGALVLSLRRRSRRPLLVAIGVLAALGAVVLTMKYGIGRPGPRDTEAHGGSFPSGHTAAVLGCYGTLALLLSAPRTRRRVALLAVTALLTVLVGAALVYDDYHWLSDVVASVTLGIALLIVVATVSGHEREPRTPCP